MALAATSALAGCTGLQKDEGKATPVNVVGVNGALPQARANSVVARAVADAPNPQAIQKLETLMETISSEPLFKDNDVDLLIDGPDTYKAMLAAIEGAKSTINLETYIFNEDPVGQRFSDALIAQSRRGVAVRVIFDSMGSRESSAGFFDAMKAAGIEVVAFNPVNPLNGGNPLNLNVRDHRKLLVVDGRIAFTGGINLDRNYASSSSTRSRARQREAAGWRDTHIQIRGPAVAGFQRLFLNNWKEGGGAADADERRFFPAPVAAGHDLVRVLSAVGGDGQVSAIRIAYGHAMDAAAARIWITQSYFGPDPDFLKTMTEAARRGVDVRIMVTGISDAPMLLHVSRSCYGDLLEAGVRIYESNDIMLHAKTAVIDGVWSTVGSSNLDYRSFIHNYEVNAVVVSEDFGRTMEALFQSDLTRAREVTLEDWKHRPFIDRIKEAFSKLAQYWL